MFALNNKCTFKYKNIISINVFTIFWKAWHTLSTDKDALLRKMDKLSHFVHVEIQLTLFNTAKQL